MFTDGNMKLHFRLRERGFYKLGISNTYYDKEMFKGKKIKPEIYFV